jgi:serine O-acetyltransferase
MNPTLRSDLYRYHRSTGFTGLLKALRYPGFCYTYFFRKSSTTSKYNPLGLFYRLMLRHYKYKFGFQIPAGTRIGPGLHIAHFGTVVINKGVVMGKNCNLSHGVTIGQANRGEKKGIPVFGDFVWIGTGAVVVGQVKIGSNVLIAPNTYVNMDVPDQSIVIGNPAKIISRENPTEGYINNVID